MTPVTRAVDVHSLRQNADEIVVGDSVQDGSKSKLFILSEYVNKTEKIGGMWTNMNSYRENEALPDIFTWSNLRHNCFMFKYSTTESSQRNYC